MTTKFQARGTEGSVVANTAKDAATLFFIQYNKARKCDIREGLYEDGFFTQVISRNSNMFKMDDVTRKMIEIALK